MPALLDANVNGKPKKLLATANRNGFYYVLDRVTGEFLTGTPYAKQTWAKGLDVDGRPIVRPETEPSEEGTLVWPSLVGAANWYSPAYSPNTGLFYVAAREQGSYYYKSEVEYKPGQPYLGGGEQSLGGDEASGAVRWNPEQQAKGSDPCRTREAEHVRMEQLSVLPCDPGHAR